MSLRSFVGAQAFPHVGAMLLGNYSVDHGNGPERTTKAIVAYEWEGPVIREKKRPTRASLVLWAKLRSLGILVGFALWACGCWGLGNAIEVDERLGYPDTDPRAAAVAAAAQEWCDTGQGCVELEFGRNVMDPGGRRTLRLVIDRADTVAFRDATKADDIGYTTKVVTFGSALTFQLEREVIFLSVEAVGRMVAMEWAQKVGYSEVLVYHDISLHEFGHHLDMDHIGEKTAIMHSLSRVTRHCVTAADGQELCRADGCSAPPKTCGSEDVGEVRQELDVEGTTRLEGSRDVD